jgi:hypothetical protein
MLITTAYTPDYEYLAQRLADSCAAFGVQFHGIAYEDRGSWAANCNYKPAAIREALGKTRGPVCWLDADMYLIAPLPQFRPADVWYYHDPAPLPSVFDWDSQKIVPNTKGVLTPWGGHIAFGHGAKALALLEAWQSLCERYSGITTDEQCLLLALQQMHVNTAPLPDPRTWIFHTPEGQNHGKPESWRLL